MKNHIYTNPNLRPRFADFTILRTAKVIVRVVLILAAGGAIGAVLFEIVH